MHLSGLFVYPVKSLRGCAVHEAEVDALGLVGDRRFLVVDAQDQFLTQRTLPRMALIETALTASTLTLTAPGAGSVVVALNVDRGASVRTVAVWKASGLQAEDCGDEVAAWLTRFLETPCRLVRIGATYHRPVTKPAARPGDVTAFTDAVPFLGISEASLADLNQRLAARGESALPMDRFRPNLVLAGTEPFAEDTWPRFRVGEIVLRAAGPCVRCIVTTTNQQTAERGKEPLSTLASYRRDPADPTRLNFGQNLIHETKRGTLRVGDSVEPLQSS